MEQAFVVAVGEIEPHRFPGLVSGVGLAGGVEGDSGSQRDVHGRAL